MKKICKICGKEFEADNKRRLLCSKECQRISKLRNNRKWQSKNKEKFRKIAREYEKKRRLLCSLDPLPSCKVKSCFECPFPDCIIN